MPLLNIGILVERGLNVTKSIDAGALVAKVTTNEQLIEQASSVGNNVVERAKDIISSPTANNLVQQGFTANAQLIEQASLLGNNVAEWAKHVASSPSVNDLIQQSLKATKSFDVKALSSKLIPNEQLIEKAWLLGNSFIEWAKQSGRPSQTIQSVVTTKESPDNAKYIVAGLTLVIISSIFPIAVANLGFYLSGVGPGESFPYSISPGVSGS